MPKNRAQGFLGTHTFIAVVHAKTPDQAARNVKLAKLQGADGALLINHDTSHGNLLECYEAAALQCPTFWIGLNFKDLNPIDALNKLPSHANCLWRDLTEHEVGNEGSLTRTMRIPDVVHMSTRESPMIIFGGLAFNHQFTPRDLADAAKIGSEKVDVLITGGDGIGQPPSLEKVRTVREALGKGFPLAIAGGMTPDIVNDYKPYVNIFLAATLISYRPGELDPVMVREMAEAVAR